MMDPVPDDGIFPKLVPASRRRCFVYSYNIRLTVQRLDYQGASHSLTHSLTQPRHNPSFSNITAVLFLPSPSTPTTSYVHREMLASHSPLAQ
mmetsp:Transcript_39938/g.59257  ORF Transcript_39938/g.59257 Transcript_39938/m.59257 type:complete len:92 (-) Transcript_39938:453-728(-)